MEEWKDIPTLEGRYQASTNGRIRSLDTITNNGTQLRKGRVRKLSYDDYGYLHVCINQGGKHLFPFVHRLVALTFIPNPFGYSFVNHKDESKDNNSIDNLEWCDAKYNSNYGTRNIRISEKLKSLHLHRKNALPIDQFDKRTGRYIRSYNSIDEAVALNGFSTRSHISECCSKKTKRKSAYGFVWKYKETVNPRFD